MDDRQPGTTARVRRDREDVIRDAEPGCRSQATAVPQPILPRPSARILLLRFPSDVLTRNRISRSVQM